MSQDSTKAKLQFLFIQDLGIDKLKAIFGDDYTLPTAPDEDGAQGYAEELAFHGVEDNDGTSAIPSIFGIEKPERDPPYGFLAQTHRNFIRIYLMQLTRIEMSKKPRSKLKDLSRACEYLPIEIFFEIFSHLQPIDLYHLCMAGQPFYSFLVGSEASESTWINAFAEYSHRIPLPLPNIPGFRWAHLLFGPSTCTASPPGKVPCNRRGAVIDFANNHRVCRKCWPEHYVNKYRHPVYEHDDPIWELLPSTKRRIGGKCSVWYSDNMHYLPHVDQTAEDLALKKAELSEEMYQQHIESLKADASARENLVTVGQQWSDHFMDEAGRILYDKMWKDWKPKIVRKLTDLGFTTLEADPASWVLVSMQYNREIAIYKLSPKVWRKYKPQLVKHVQQTRRDRLEQDIVREIDYELGLVRDLLEKYMNSQTPSSLEYLPTAEHLLATEPFYSSAIEVIANRHKPGHPMDRYEKYFPDCVDRWQQDTRSSYTVKIPHSPDRPSSSPTGPTLSEPNSPHDLLSLATSVFECLDCPSTTDPSQPWQPGRALIGWQAMNGHLSCRFRNWQDNIVYSAKGAEAARSLSTLGGLDPQTALADDLDALDHRFTCANCPIGPTGRRGYRGHKVWTWRECVYHFIQMNRVGDADHHTPKWNRLSPDMAAYVKKREVPASIHDLSWQCLHCRPIACINTAKKTTIEHVMSSHQIEKPRIDIDFKYTMRGPLAHRVVIGLSEHPTPAQYYCLLCEKPKSQLYAYRSIGPHLLNKHAVKVGEEGRDYRCMPLYDAQYP